MEIPAALSTPYLPKGTLEASVEQFENTPFADLKTYDYGNYNFVMDRYYLGYHVFPEASSRIPNLVVFQTAFPVEYMRMIDPDHLYTVTKLGQGYYAFSVFARTVEKKAEPDEANDVSVPGIYEYWEYIDETYYVADRLTFADLEGLRVGDSVERLWEIAPVLTNEGRQELVLLTADGIALIAMSGWLYDDGGQRQQTTVREIKMIPFGSDPAVPSLVTPDLTYQFAILRLESIDLP